MSRLLIGLLLLLLLLLGQSCHPDPAETESSPADRRVADSLTVLRQAYTGMDLAAAIDHARRLRWRMDRADWPPAARAEVLQYLALLHYDYSLYPDSIHYYTGAAAALLDHDPPSDLLARQMLARAYSSYFHFAWLDMDMAAELGRELLEGEQPTPDELYGLLLIAQGVARKKTADQLPEGPGRHQAFTDIEAQYKRAAQLFRRSGSERYRQALDELAILYHRYPDGPKRVKGILAELEDAEAPFFGRPDRIRGYHHGFTDSAAHYYRRLLNGPQLQNFKYRTEATYRLANAAREVGDYDTALHELWREMQDSGCCPPDYTRPPGEEPLACTARASCNYYLAARAAIYLERYQQTGQASDLTTANTLCRVALDYYEASFYSAGEESVLNKISEIGRRLLDVSLQATVTQLQQDPTEVHADAVLRAMEMGKTFLLSRDILDAQLPSPPESAGMETLQELRVAINLLKDRYLENFSLPPSDLREFQRLSARYQQLEQSTRAAFTTELEGFSREAGFPGVGTIRAGLAPGQSFLEYAETEADIFGLYVDCDTFSVFAVDTIVRSFASQLTEQLKVSSHATPAEYARTAGRLYNHLLGPVAHCLPGKRELLLVPTTSLNTIPFSALTTSAAPAATYDSLSYLLDRHAVRYLASWRVDRQLAANRLEELPDHPAIGAWTHPGLRYYLADLGEGLMAMGNPDSRHYLGTGGERERFLRQSPDYDLLHLSVHATGNPQRLYDNYLYLTDQDSLNGLHISPRDLRARLVVLAACSTARGHANRGEGTFSLTRSFHLAGVPDVVCSLYDVPALATGQVLEQFYGYLRAGYPPTQSLTQAQRQCRSGHLGPRMMRPQQWGGLILG